MEHHGWSRVPRPEIRLWLYQLKILEKQTLKICPFLLDFFTLSHCFFPGIFFINDFFLIIHPSFLQISILWFFFNFRGSIMFLSQIYTELIPEKFQVYLFSVNVFVHAWPMSKRNIRRPLTLVRAPFLI